MTIDKMEHYINCPEIVETINKCNESQLINWLSDIQQHIGIMYNNKQVPINIIAERELINYRLGNCTLNF